MILRILFYQVLKELNGMEKEYQLRNQKHQALLQKKMIEDQQKKEKTLEKEKTLKRKGVDQKPKRVHLKINFKEAKKEAKFFYLQQNPLNKKVQNMQCLQNQNLKTFDKITYLQMLRLGES